MKLCENDMKLITFSQTHSQSQHSTVEIDEIMRNDMKLITFSQTQNFPFPSVRFTSYRAIVRVRARFPLQMALRFAPIWAFTTSNTLFPRSGFLHVNGASDQNMRVT
jgi:hypothetical protein